MEYKYKDSNLEFLKLCSIVMIVLSHGIPGGGGNSYHIVDIFSATTNIQIFLVQLLKYGGQFGNDIFVICSAWFLTESRRINWKRIMHLIIDNWFISIVFLMCFIFLGVSVPIKLLVNQLFPTLMGTNWFITCYIIFYILHPIFNNTINSLKQKQLFTITVSLALLYLVFPLIKGNLLYASDLTGFISIYFIVAYMKMYMQNIVKNRKLNICLMLISAILNLMVILTTLALGLKFEAFADKMMRWCVFNNILLVITSLCLFNIFNGKKTYHSIWCNYLASLSMLVYVIHANDLMLKIFRYDCFAKLFGTYGRNYDFIICMIYGLSSLFFSFVLAVLYKQVLQKYIHRLAENVVDKVVVIFDAFASKIIQQK